MTETSRVDDILYAGLTFVGFMLALIIAEAVIRAASRRKGRK